MCVHVHIPVLANEILAYLKPQMGNVIIDSTLGLGGHTKLMLEHGAKVYGLDTDARNLEEAKELLKDYSKKNQIEFIHTNFSEIEDIAQKIVKKEGHIDGILFDLGISSVHVDDSTRGFSFLKDGPLDMRLNPIDELTAATIVNTYSVEDLSQLIYTLGEDHFARRIAYNIDEYRKHIQFTSTLELADFIAGVVHSRNAYYAKRTLVKDQLPGSFIWPEHDRKQMHEWGLRQRRHPATRTFQALRMAVNKELEVLEKGLRGALASVSSKGKIAVISFHSLEDGIVKRIFKEAVLTKQYTLLEKKPISPTNEELKNNPRARSAKLRVIERK